MFAHIPILVNFVLHFEREELMSQCRAANL